MEKLVQMINSDDDLKQKALESIKKELDIELKKPLKKRDFDKIAELTVQYRELQTGESEDIITKQGVNKLNTRIEQYKNKHMLPVFRYMKKLAPAFCVTAVIVIGNCMTVSAWDMNIFSAVIELTKGGFSVDFGKNEPEPVELPTSVNDPYGFIAKLAEYDIEFETPHYIPEGFILTDVETNVNESFANTVRFLFKKKKQSINIDYIRYWNDVSQVGIPSDHYKISETEVNGSPAIVSKEDGQYTITYQKNKTVFFLFSQDVSYDECDEIIQSIR